MDNFKIKLDKAKNLHKTKEFEKADNLYNELILEKPDYFETYYYLGNLKITLKDFEKAEKYFREAINHKPDFFQSYMNLGNTLKELSKFSEAEQIYKKTIELNPTYAKAYYNLGALQQDQGRYEDAEMNLKKSIEIDTNFFQAYLNLGSTLKNLSKFDEAEKIFRKAINLKPDHAKAYNNLGTVLVDLVKLEDAEDNIKKAIKLDPELTEAFINLDLVIKQKELLKIINNKVDTKLKDLSPNPFVSTRKVEKKIIDYLYKIKTIELDETIKYDARYGNGKCSPDFNFFKTNPNLIDIENDLKEIMKKAVKSDIFIIDSFFNILKAGGGTTPHKHINQFDKTSGLVNQKYSLTYYLEIGDQSCDEPGILKLYEPNQEILPEKGTIVIIPASRSHSATYNGKLDRIMIGINFYSI
tara:strand:- start:93 stop:1331 length:1239 start_codon:yes stop_codon:yes gene_type:complete